jgi:hypothetical protein
MVLLAPSLFRALEAADRFSLGKGPAQDVLDAVPEALSFANEGIQLYRLLAPGILRNETVNELLRQIELEHRAQVDGFEQIMKVAQTGRYHGLKGTVASVRSACERLLELFNQLQDLERQGGASSPFPLIDSLVKTAYNLLQGQVDAVELKPRLDGAAGLVGTLRTDVERFRLLYDQSAIVEATREPIGLLEAGIGAGHSYLASGNKVELEDSIRLLLQCSPPLLQAMQRMDKQAASDLKFSKLRYLEELARAAAVPRAGQEWLLENAKARVLQVLDHYARELASVESSALHFEVAGELEVCRQQSQKARDAYVSWAAAGQSALGSLPEDFEALEGGYGALRERLSQEYQRYSQALHLQELRELIGRTLLGQLSLDSLRKGVRAARERQGDFLEKFKDGATSLEAAELEELIREHGPALDQIEMYFETPNPFFLMAGWRTISGTVPRILELSSHLRSQAEAAAGPAKTTHVSCPRCGADNPRNSKYCNSCRMQLPLTDIEVTDYTDVVGGAEEEPVPENLAKLAALAAQAETGAITRSHLQNEVQRLIDQSALVERMFENQIIPLMGRDATFDQLVRDFSLQMKQYVEGMLMMRSFGEGGTLAQLQSGVDNCFDAGNQVVALQAKLRVALAPRS